MAQCTDLLAFTASAPVAAKPQPVRQSLHSALKLSPIGLQILRRTAQVLASTPGGLRFVPGSRPWLDNLQA